MGMGPRRHTRDLTWFPRCWHATAPWHLEKGQVSKRPPGKHRLGEAEERDTKGRRLAKTQGREVHGHGREDEEEVHTGNAQGAPEQD